MLTVGIGLGCYVLGVVSGVVLTAVLFVYRVYRALQRKGQDHAGT